MQQTIQRRAHAASVADGSGSGAESGDRDRRRLERREAKKLREKKAERVKRGAPCVDPLVRSGCLAFALFALAGFAAFEAMRSPASEDPVEAFGQKLQRRAGSTLSKLRGGMRYIVPESMRNIGCKSNWYAELRREYDTKIYPKDEERSLAWVDAKRREQGIYVQHPQAKTEYDVHNCPEYPPQNYPIQWPVLDVLKNWPPDDPTPHAEIYQGICIFDYRTELRKANNYREKELPFIVRNDPAAARTAERWGDAEYVKKLLMGEEDTNRRTEYSPDNHFMYWVDKRPKDVKKQHFKEVNERRRNGEDVHDGFGRGDQEELAEAMKEMEEVNVLKSQIDAAMALAEENPEDEEAAEELENLRRKMKQAKAKVQRESTENWQPPTENLRMTYLQWLQHANVTDDKLGPDNPHWYFRLIGCGKMGAHTEDGSCDKGSSEWLFDELTYFQPREGKERPFYMINPRKQQGIHCRFGMKGVIAENHFDLSRNAINVLYGQRRYILAHPNQCRNMNLLPKGHPSSRHSAVDWSDPDLEAFPDFERARVNEIVMQPGDVLYLPTNWFHYIVSLELNFQCNTRSGGQNLYRKEVTDCGF